MHNMLIQRGTVVFVYFEYLKHFRKKSIIIHQKCQHCISIMHKSMCRKNFENMQIHLGIIKLRIFRYLKVFVELPR